MKKFFVLFFALALCAAALLASPVTRIASAEKPQGDTVKAKFHAKGERAIPEQFIVVFDETVTGPAGEFSMSEQMAEQMILTYGGKIKHVYKHALNGYAVRMPKDVAVALSNDPRVLFVELGDVR